MPLEPEPITAVAILRGEEAFVREWVAYHRVMGITRFVLYDDDPEVPLRRILKRESDCVTVVPWFGKAPPGVNKQLGAYRDAVARQVASGWVTFIDGDEFIVLRRHETLHAFLGGLGGVDAVLLTWHAFGHCGYFNDPPGLITSVLIRRRARPGRQTKTIVRHRSIAAIESPHECVLKPGGIGVDANGRPYAPELYAGKTDVAHINHYMCRSFKTWMKRVSRGDTVHEDPKNCPKDNAWRLDKRGCLKKFVRICIDTNELVDDYMLKYVPAIDEMLKRGA